MDATSDLVRQNDSGKWFDGLLRKAISLAALSGESRKNGVPASREPGMHPPEGQVRAVEKPDGFVFGRNQQLHFDVLRNST